VGQLARLRGLRVVGIASKEAKCRYVVDALGFDACVSHLSPTMADELKAACPAWVDVYFEKRRGETSAERCSTPSCPCSMRARMTICGLISSYGGPAGANEIGRSARSIV
jgi:NADPH-dependent curcumin reductase